MRAAASRAGRVAALVVGLVVGLGSTSACRLGDLAGPAPWAPSLPPAAGLRVDADNSLRLWTGTSCHQVTRVVATFEGGDNERAQLVLVAPEPGITIERLDLGDPPDELTVQTALPAGFDWHSSKNVRIQVDGADPSWGSITAVDAIVSGSAEHPPTHYLFGKNGWKDEAAVQRDNGRTFLAICTPDPARG